MLTRILLFSALILLVTSLSPLFCQSIVDPATVVEALAWSPDGSMIGAGYADGRLDLFDTRTGTALEFWSRNAAAVQTYKDTVDVGGRIYTAPSVSMSDIQGNTFYYDGRLFTLNTASFFNRDTSEVTYNFSAPNAHVILTFTPPVGGSTWTADSCPETP